MIDPLWKKMERAAADKKYRAKLNRKARRAPHTRVWSERKAEKATDASAARQVIPEDTRSLIGRIVGDPLPGRSALDMERGR